MADVIEHSGPILEDSVWQSSDEHLITGDVTVYPQVTLTIEAGATIRVAAVADDTAGGSDPQRSELIVNGSLIAGGTEAEPVTLTSNAATPSPGDWGGIRADSRFPFILRHAVVEYGTVGVDYRLSDPVAASVTIEDSVIRNSAGNGIYLSASGGANVTAEFRNNQIYGHTSYGVYVTNSATMLATIDGNELRENGSDGLFISNSSGTLSGLTVTGNAIHGNNSYGLSVSSSNGNAGEPSISGNRIIGNANTGIYVYTYGNVASLWRIAGNEIQTNSGDGLYFHYGNRTGAGTTALIRDNLIVDNSSNGVYLRDYYSSYYPRGGGFTKAQLNLNRIQGNGSWGIQASRTRGVDIVHNQLGGNQGGGIALGGLTETTRINFNDLVGDNGTYEVQNADSRAVDARYNGWGDVTSAEMAAGGNPKDIVRIYDIFDNNGRGAVDYGQYLAAAPALIEAPVSWVKSPADGAVLKAEVVRIEGSASAAEDIDRVEVSTDGGTTWVVAEGTLSWSYEWTVPGDGSYLLRSRVVTAGGVLESPGAGNRITLDNSQPGTPGTLVEDEIWDGELIITGDITVPAGVTLTIAPGSLITFAPNRDDLFGGSDPSRAELTVDGALIIQGTADSPVELTSNAPFPLGGDWAGIKVTGGVLDMQYATVEYAENGVTCEADGQPVECTITDSTIRSNSGYGIYGHAMRAGQLDLWLEKNDLSANLQGGAYLYAQGGSGNPLLTAVLVDNAFRSNSNYGAYLYTTSGAEAQIELTENLFEGSGEGVYVYNNRASALSFYRLFGNEISSNGTGLRYYNYYSTVDPEITNNFVHDNLSYGVHLSTAGTASLAPTLTGNNIIDNGQGIYSKATGVLTVAQSQLYGNGVDIYNDASVAIDARQNWWGTSTTNILATGAHPRDLNNIHDLYDDANKGLVDYSDWLTLFERPLAPTLDPVQTPVAAETQTLSGTKEPGTGIGANGRLLALADDESAWSVDIDLREGDNPLSVYAVDRTGILSDLVSVLIVRDTEPPRILSSIPSDGDTVSTQMREVDVVVYDDATDVDFDHAVAQAAVLGSQGNTVPGAWSVRTGHLLFTADTFLAPDTYSVDLSLADTPLGNSISVSFGFTVDATDITPPLPVPVTVDADGDGSTAVLDWSGYDEAGQVDVASYSVYVDSALFTQVAAMTPVVTLPAGEFTHTVDGLTKGVQYFFAVVARDVSGNVNTSVTPESAIPTDVIPPEDVTGLRAESTDSSLVIGWTHSANSAGDLAAYRVYVGADTQGAEVASNLNSLELTGLDVATAYQVRVTAVDRDGNESAGVTLDAATLLPNPEGLTVTPQVQAVDLTWTGVEPSNLVQQYAVYAAVSDFADVGSLTPVKLVGPNSRSTRVDALTSGVPYYFAVTAINLSGGELKAVTTVSAVPLSDKVTISGLVTDPSGQPVAGIEICISGAIAENCATRTDAAGRYVLDTDGSSLPSGQYLVAPRATAATGPYVFTPVNARVEIGTASVSSVDFNATYIPDTTAPETGITAGPAEGATVTSSLVTFGWSGSDDRAAALVFAYRLDDQAWSTFDAATGTTLTGLADGARRFQVKARDAAGNEDATPAERFFTVDSTPPAPASAFTAAVTDAGIRLDWTHSPSADVARYRLYWNGGSGDIDYGQPLANILYPANAYVITGLPGEGAYRFGLRAEDNPGNRELNTNVTAAVDVVGLSVSVNVESDTYDRGQDVPVTGLVLSPLGDPVVNVAVEIAVRSNSVSRFFTSYTDAQGGFRYNFQPLTGEAGSYTVEALVESNGLEQTASDSFRILGLWLQPASLTLDMSMNASRTVDLTLRNIGDIALTDLQYAAEDLDPTDPLTALVDAAALPERLEPGEQVTVPVELASAAGDAPGTPAAVRVTAESAEGSVETAVVNVNLGDAVAHPVIEPRPLKVGVRPGEAVTRALTVTNAGYASVVSAQLSLQQPDAYPWIQVLSGDLGALDPRQTKEVQIRIEPPADMPLGKHVVQLDLTYDGKLQSAFIEVEITATDLGVVAVKVHDDTGSVVQGAEVSLISQEFYVNTGPTVQTVAVSLASQSLDTYSTPGAQEYNNVIQGTTDAAGDLSLADVPAGDYRYLIQASGHEPLEGEVRVEPGTDPQPLGVILVTELVTVDFKVTKTTIEDQYEVTLEITYATNLTKPTLYPWPSNVGLSFFPEETQEGTINITNTSNHAPVRNLVMSSADLDPDDNELELVFSNGEKVIQLPELGPKESIQVPYRARIPNAATAKLNSRQLGNITVSGKYTYSIDGQALEGTTTTPIPAIYSRPRDLRLPGIAFINDERDGNLYDLEYQGTSYRHAVVSNRDVQFDFDYDPAREVDLRALSHIYGGPAAASILAENTPFWTGIFNGPPPLTFKGDSVSFDIDGLEEAMEARMLANRASFLGHARSIGLTGQWADRSNPDAYLFPVSITTIRDHEIIVGECLSCGYDPQPPTPRIPSLPLPGEHGEVKIQILQKIGLEREAFDIALGLTPNVAQLDNVSITLNVTDADGADASDLFYEIVTQQSGLANLAGGTVTGPVDIGWQLVPSSLAGGLQPEGRNYGISASITYEYQGNSYSYDTPVETRTVLPMPKLTVDYEAPYVVIAGRPAKIRVRVTNNGAGAANGLTIASAQPEIVENVNNIPISFAITGSSPTADAAGFQPGEMTISFDSVPPGGTVEGYWDLTTTRHGYFVDFAASIKHLSYKGVEIDPLIETVSTKLVPAIGGMVTLLGCTSTSGVDIELWQSGTLIANDSLDADGAYYMQDLDAGEYEWRAVDNRGQPLESVNITVLGEQPTALITSFVNLDPDLDKDGLEDCWELKWFGNLDQGPQDDLADEDDLTNADEFEWKTDPTNPDTDEDGLSDGDEVHVYGTSPLIPDTDGDGIGDGDEVAQGTDPLDPSGAGCLGGCATTVITHGYLRDLEFNSDGGLHTEQSWTVSLAKAIAGAAGKGTIYLFKDGTWSAAPCAEEIEEPCRIDIDAGGQGEGETILIFDWLSESDRAYKGWAEAAGDSLFANLVDGAIKGQWALGNLHFVGHSRGAVVNSEAIERLIYAAGTGALPDSIHVDQTVHMTALDPHPWTDHDWIPGSAEDDKVNGGLIENDEGVVAWRHGDYAVAFADNYYQQNGLGCPDHPTGLASYPGMSYARNLSALESDLPIKYTLCFGLVGQIDGPMNHLGTYAWYHGTVDIDAISNEDDGQELDISVYRQDWYRDGEGVIDGYYFSRLGFAADIGTWPLQAGETGLLASEQIDVTEDKTFVPDGSPVRWVFNGDFEQTSILGGHVPGWEAQSGGVDTGGADVDSGYLELKGFIDGFENNFKRHNRFYIPTSATTLRFRIQIRESDEPNWFEEDVDHFFVRLSNENSEPLLVYLRPLVGEEDEFSWVAIDLYQWRGSVRDLTFEILDQDGETGLINSEVWIDDVDLVEDRDRDCVPDSDDPKPEDWDPNGDGFTGVCVTSANGDSDGDGMPDWYEDLHGFDKGDTTDGSLDADDDGLSNVVEFELGSDPTDEFDAAPVTLKDLASLAWNAYADQNNPDCAEIVYPGSCIPVGFERIEDDFGNDYVSVAYKRGRDIVFAFKGTQFTSLHDWATNYGYGSGVPNPVFKNYVGSAAQFINVIADSPEYADYRIQLTGHSLGGGIAQLLGDASGCKTITFNSAGAAFVIEAAQGEFDPVKDYCGNQPDILHYRINGDIVSLLTDQIQPENVITIESEKGVPSVLPHEVVNLGYYHSIKTMWFALDKDRPETSGVPDVNLLASIGVIVNAKLTYEDRKKEFLSEVLFGDPYYYDPPVSNGYVFDAGTGPLFESVALPFRDDGEFYELFLRINDVWTPFGPLEGVDWYRFPGSFQTFAVGNWPDYGPSLEGVIFGLTFASSGTFDGTVTPFEVSQWFCCPVVEAGSDQATRLGSIVNLVGKVIDLDEGPSSLTFKWSQLDGPSVSLDGADTATPSFTAIAEGNYEFSLEVFDGEAWSEPDTVTITVPLLGDIDGDDDVDRDDISLISAARNTPASGPNDLRDLDADGTITGLDARKAVLECTRPRCATQ